jgi:gamma-glutamylcyclotransferase (GGCT)/AIG2-like uncharacterized protein YtfP
MSEQRPVFVYGTLRPGQPNWERLLAGRTERTAPGWLGEVDLLDCGHYPAAVERPGASGAAGDVVWIRPAVWRAVLADLADGVWVAHCSDAATYREHWRAIADAGGRAPGPIPGRRPWPGGSRR